MSLAVELLAEFLSIVGIGLVVLAALGLLRMPDLYARMQAASKAAPLGVALLAMAAALQAGSAEVAIRAVLIFGFLCLTAPIAAHAIVRAGYRVGVPLADEAVVDELAAARQTTSQTPPEPMPRAWLPVSLPMGGLVDSQR